mgnify:CR=1 FL=1
MPEVLQQMLNYVIAIYIRLSAEDGDLSDEKSESNSVVNQRAYIRRFIDLRPEFAGAQILEFCDDGYSGTNMERPAVQRLLEQVRQRKINCIIVKDMSRFGRDYLQVGFYTDMLFPDFGVHFIAVNDGVDSTRGENEFTAIRNVFNEMYACDTSKKIRATWQSKGKSGEHLATIPPYGYMKDPDNKKKWIIDEEAAAVVQQIFALCVSGLGPTQICHWLEKNQVLNPTFYWLSKGMKVGNKPKPGANPYKWTNETVSRMLEKIEYLGHTVNFRTRKQSYKSKKKLWNDPSEWVILRTRSRRLWKKAYSSLCRTYADHAAVLPKWAIWVFSPGCFIVQSAAARCINAAQRTLPKNRSILSVRPIGKAKICVRPIPLKMLSCTKLFCGTCGKQSSM